MSDYLKFDGCNAKVAEVKSGSQYTLIDLSKVCAISSQAISLEDNTEAVCIIFDGGFNIPLTLNVDVYSELLRAWLDVKVENYPKGRLTGRGWVHDNSNQRR